MPSEPRTSQIWEPFPLLQNHKGTRLGCPCEGENVVMGVLVPRLSMLSERKRNEAAFCQRELGAGPGLDRNISQGVRSSNALKEAVVRVTGRNFGSITPSAFQEGAKGA